MITRDLYDPANVGTLYAPRTAAMVEAGRAASLTPSSGDKVRTILLLVDAQVDFIHADGALSVPGAVEDTRRTLEWMYAHMGEITTIAASLDSHVPIQIFSPTWWADEAGAHPPPFTVITTGMLRAGQWRPLYEHDWSAEYVRRLEEQAKKALMIWPYHTLIGTPGHSLTPALYEAIAYHASARQSQPVFLSKGSIPKTEHYSIMEPEVKVPDQPLGELNVGFLAMLARYDRVYVAGQAKSHCVLETVSSMVRHFQRAPEIVGKMRVLMDCTSSVAHPTIDFDALANESFARFAEQGLKRVTSADPLT
jgi:nicotinamidase-related amidase